MTGLHGPDPFTGRGETAEMCRSIDWSATPLGSVEGWPAALRSAVRICLESPFPMNLWCGEALVLNDAYSAVLGSKHPGALGQPGPEVRSEIWSGIAPMF